MLIVIAKEHSRYKGCSKLVANDTTTVTFLSFCTEDHHANEIELQLSKCEDMDQEIVFDSFSATINPNSLENKLQAIVKKSKLTKTLNDLLSRAEETVQQNKPIQVNLLKVHQDSRLLCRATPGSIGYGIFPTQSVDIKEVGRQPIPTGIAVQSSFNMITK